MVIKYGKPLGTESWPRDSSTSALLSIDYAHHEIHSGSHYFYQSHHDMAKNSVNDHLIITPDTDKYSHMVFLVNSSAGQIHVEISEGATYSSIGTLEVPRNRNRNFPDAAGTLIYETPTITGQGTVLISGKYGIDDKKLSSGGTGRGDSEIVLKRNTVYLFRVTETNIDNTVLNITLDWYEHTNK